MAKRVYAIAMRYAQALYELAKEQKSLDKWQEDLQDLSSLTEDASVAEFLSNPKIASARKHKVLAKLSNIDPLMLNLVDMLVATRRLGIMRAVSGEYNRLLNEARGVEDAIVTTAKPSSEADIGIIRQQLSKITGKKINVVTATDPGLIAGLKARIGDKLIDGSVSRRLVLLQNEISQGRI